MSRLTFRRSGLGLIHDIPSCHDLIQGIMTEAQEIIQQRLNRLID
jgi:nitronate monooxygenase